MCSYEVIRTLAAVVSDHPCILQNSKMHRSIASIYDACCDVAWRQVNLMFLLNIMRVLVTKLRRNQSAEVEQAR